jgi:hypothetical protein
VPSPTHIEFDGLLRGMRDALAVLAGPMGGVVDIAIDPQDAMEILAVAPARWRIVLGWAGYGTHPDARIGMAVTKVYTVVQRAIGMQADRAADIYAAEGTQAVPTMAILIESVSAWVRAMRLPVNRNADAAGFSLSGSSWLVLPEGNNRCRQHQLDFDLVHALAPHMAGGSKAIVPVLIS